jgi:hypothetical protein
LGLFAFYYNNYMAKIVRVGDELVLELSFWEKIGALHSNPRVSAASVEKIEFVEKLWRSETLRGVRAPGIALPYILLLGTLRGFRYKDFCAMSGRGEGVVLTLKSGPFARWIFTLKQPQADFLDFGGAQGL